MRNVSLGISLSLMLAGTLSAASPARYLGNWKNADGNTGGVTRLVITGAGVNLKLHAFGKCSPTDCDWGVVDAVAHSKAVNVAPATDTQAVTALYDQGFKSVWVVLTVRDANTLAADFYTRYKAGDSRPPTTSTETYVRVKEEEKKPAPGGEDCIDFNPALAKAEQVQGSWKVTVGSMWMLDFGADAASARKALAIIQKYKLNKQCFVGRPDPSLQYYLVGNAIPAGAAPGEDCVGFNPAKTEVKQVSGSWKIVEGSHWMFDFGANQAEARQAFALIKKYGANQSCFVGRPNAKMSYLRK
jgi:hypothetical protein